MTQISHFAAVLAVLLGVVARLPSQETRPRPPARLVAFFWHESPNDVEALDGIRAALQVSAFPHEIIIKQAGGDAQRAAQLLEEIAGGQFDLLLAMGTQSALLARERFTDLPIVYAAVTNPVASRIVSSWSGSSRNLAGCSNWIPPETVLHVFKLAVPKLRRLGMLRSKSQGVVSAAELSAMREHLAARNEPTVEIVEAVVEDESQIGSTVKKLLAARVDALWIPIDFTIYQNMSLVRTALGDSKLPLVSSSLQGARNGALAGVHVDYNLLGRRAGALAADILTKRKRIGEVPVDTMQSYQVIVNLTAARACGYELPLSLLALADLLIDDRAEPKPETRDGRR